jgi:hypothetical protein
MDLGCPIGRPVQDRGSNAQIGSSAPDGRNLTDRRYRDSPDEVASLAVGRSLSLGLVARY